MTEQADPFRRNMVLLWAAQFISKIGDQLFAVSAIYAVMMMAADGVPGDGALEGGIFEMAHALPALLIGPFLGVLVDRHRGKRVMIATDIARAILLASVPFFLFYGMLDWWVLTLIGFAVFTFTSAFGPARDAFVPEVAKGRDLTRINSIFQTSIPIAVLLGSGILALVEISETSPLTTLMVLIGVDASTFIVSAILLLLVKVKEEKMKRAADARSLAGELGETVSYIAKDRRLSALLISTAISNFFIMGPAILGAALLTRKSLGFSEEMAPRMYGLFEGSMLVGMLLGMWWVIRAAKKYPRGKVLVWGLILDGVTYLPFVLLPQGTPFVFYLLIICFHGFFIPWIWTIRTALIQEYYPKERHGRIFALIGLTVTGFHALSAGATGWAGEYIDAHWLFFIGGIGGLLSGLIAWRFKELWETR